MKKTRIFIDTCIFDWWASEKIQNQEKKFIEKIRTLIEEGKIAAFWSIENELELLRFVTPKEWEEKNEKWSKVGNCGTITPDCVIGDTDGSYQERIDEAKDEWMQLSKLIYDEGDSKHIITAIYEEAEFFITVDDKLINKMNNEGKEYLKIIKILKPSEFIKEISLTYNLTPKT